MQIDLNKYRQPLFWSVEDIQEILPALEKFPTPGNARRTAVVAQVRRELTDILNIKGSHK
jgi:hypothetical protein